MNRLLGIVAALALAGVAGADVINGGFETGDFTGWTLSGNTGFTSVVTNPVHSGNFAASFGPVGSHGIMEQTLAFNAGDVVVFDFWLANSGGSGTFFSATLDGQTVLSLTDFPAQPYTEYSYTVNIANNNPVLHFEYRQDPSFLQLDDVSVAIAPTPAASALLIGAPLVGLRRRRR